MICHDYWYLLAVFMGWGLLSTLLGIFFGRVVERGERLRAERTERVNREGG